MTKQEKVSERNQKLKEEYRKRRVRHWSTNQKKALKKGKTVTVLLSGKYYEFRFDQETDPRISRIQRSIDKLNRKLLELKKGVKIAGKAPEATQTVNP